ncbi:MAG: transporter substrate-binding protein [Leptospirales bacterium]
MKTYKVGILHSQTGTMSNSERPLISATQLALKEINASGGVLEHNIEHVIADGGSKAEVFANKANQLYKDGIENIFGCWTSSSRKVVKDVVEKNNQLLWYPVQYEGLETSNNIVYTGSCLNQQIEPALNWLVSKGYKNLYLIGSDYVYPKIANQLIHGLSKRLKINILGEDYKLLGESDFNSCFKAIKKAIKKSGPCIIFNTLNGDSNIGFFDQYRLMGLDPEKYPVMSVSVAENELEYIGSAANNHYLCWSYFHSLDTQANKNFVQMFTKQYPEHNTTSDPVEAAYSQVYLWKDSVEKAGSFQIDSVKNALPGASFSAPGGEYEILPNHHMKKKAMIAKISPRGKIDIVWQSAPIEPLPWLGVENANVENLDAIIHVLGEFSTEVQKTGTQGVLTRALKNSENRFKALSDASFEGVAISENGAIVDCNRAMHEMFGYTKKEIIGLGPHKLVHPDSLDDVMKRVGSNQIDYYRAKGVNKKGEAFTIEIQARPIEYMGKQARVTTIIDLTEKETRELELIHEKERAQKYLDTAGVMLIAIDLNGIVNMINKKGCDVLGYKENEIVGKNWFDNFLPEKVKKAVLKESSDLLAGKKPPVSSFENPVLTKSGEERLISWHSQELLDDNGKKTGHLSSGEDITEKKVLEQKLLLSQRIIESTSDAIVITDTAAHIIDINPAYTEITGFKKEDVMGKNPRFSKSGRHNKAFYKTMWDSILKTGSWSGEIWDRHSNGEVYPKLLSINTLHDENRKPQAYIGIFSDISMLKHTEEQLHQVAYYDPLTGLPNRSLFRDRLKHEVATSKRLNTEFALLFIDLDKFKNVNDTLGHNIGDALLEVAAKRISSRLRDNDTVSRLGGDEFTVILADIDSEQHVANVATDLIEILQDPFQLSGSEVFIGASIGISIYPKDGEELDTLTKFADLAMYQAKNAGRKTFRFFTEKMNREVQKHIEIERNLRNAIERNELELFYQPRTQLKNDKIVGCEALLRWKNKDGVFITPDQFIPIAEETGLIIPIGDWVIKMAIQQSEKWLREGHEDLLISVNVSAKQLNDKNFVQKVMDMIKWSSTQPKNIGFEITESTLMADPDRAIEILEELKTIGFEISIDDFGTGYSSLSYLRKFPIDTLKIDQSFVRDILEDKNDATIVVTIISMAFSLGLNVVAEGIELEEQKQFLKKHNCHYGQGFLFAKPLNAPDFEKLLIVSKKNVTQPDSKVEYTKD